MPERGRTLKIPWIYFLGRNTPSPSAHPSQGWRTITITGTLDPESAQPAPHIPMAQHCSEPSLTPQSFTEELQFFLQAEKQTWTPRAGPEPPSHCLVTSTLCFSLEITVWIQRRGSRLHFWSVVGWCCCFSCQNLPSSIYTAQQDHHTRKSSRELLEIECWPSHLQLVPLCLRITDTKWAC